MIKPFNKEATSTIFENAKALRQRQTDAEAILWKHLRSRKIAGKKFRRQHPIADFIVDFYCHSHRLVIEVDGAIHEKKDVRNFDKHRTEVLESLGLTVMRFTNEEIVLNIQEVVGAIGKKLKQSPPHTLVSSLTPGGLTKKS